MASMSELVSNCKCADETDFPAKWKHEEDAELIGGRDENDWPDPLKPIDWLVWEGTQGTA